MLDQVKIAYTQTNEICLGHQQKKRKEWIPTDTWQAIENRRTLKRKVLETKSERLKERCTQQYSEEDYNSRQVGISGKPRKSGRRGSQQRRARKGVQDHKVSQWQVPGNNRLTNNYGQPRATSYHRSRTGS